MHAPTWNYSSDIQAIAGGMPVAGYPNGMGFMGSAEEVRSVSTGAEYARNLNLSHEPDCLLEFQLHDPASLQNVLEVPYSGFIPRGKTKSGYSEWNYLGINSDKIVNGRLRKLP